MREVVLVDLVVVNVFGVLSRSLGGLMLVE